ncbi:MAG: PAC2 family protein, partial [Methanocorpusculum sp.]|nr:PAC2 family protein [Methanocorpusculum sp.]
ITGITGGILNEAAFRNIPAYGLLIETNFDVDPRASAAGLSVFASLYGLSLDTEDLIKQADTVEPMLQQLAEDVKNSDMTPITYEGDIMFG